MVAIYKMAGVVSALETFSPLKKSLTSKSDSIVSGGKCKHHTVPSALLHTRYFLARGSRLLCDAKCAPYRADWSGRLALQSPLTSSWSQVTSCSRGCGKQQTTAVEHPSSDSGRGKRKLTKSRKEKTRTRHGKEQASRRSECELGEKNGLTNLEEYVMNREQNSVVLLCQERTQTTWLPQAAATSEQKPRGLFQVDTITTKLPSASFSCWDQSHCVTMAVGSEASSGSTSLQSKDVEQCSSGMAREQSSFQDSDVYWPITAMRVCRRWVEKSNSPRSQRTIRLVDVVWNWNRDVGNSFCQLTHSVACR